MHAAACIPDRIFALLTTASTAGPSGSGSPRLSFVASEPDTPKHRPAAAVPPQGVLDEQRPGPGTHGCCWQGGATHSHSIRSQTPHRRAAFCGLSIRLVRENPNSPSGQPKLRVTKTQPSCQNLSRVHTLAAGPDRLEARTVASIFLRVGGDAVAENAGAETRARCRDSSQTYRPSSFNEFQFRQVNS